MNVYVILRHDHEPDQLAVETAFSCPLDAEEHAKLLRKAIRCRDDCVEVRRIELT